MVTKGLAHGHRRSRGLKWVRIARVHARIHAFVVDLGVVAKDIGARG